MGTKPDTAMSAPRLEPRAFLTDFGLAKSVATGSKLTRTGQALGTPAYMSPEQARGEVSSLTTATDVWSLGSVLFELLAGRPAFEGETSAAIVGRILLAEPTRLRRVRPDAPRGLDRVVRVALAKRARDRYRDAGALRDDLARVLRGESPRARPAGTWRRVAVPVAIASGVVLALAAFRGPRVAAPAELPSSGDSEAEKLVVASRALRHSDPRGAAGLLGQALALDPSRPGLRLERGLLLWAVGEGPAAREEWGRIAAGVPEAAAARLYLGLEALFHAGGADPRLAEAEDHLRRTAAGDGPEALLARAALAALDSEWGSARALLRDARGWVADALRGYVEGVDPAGDPQAAARADTAALEQGIPFAWIYCNRSAARTLLGDPRGGLEDAERSLALSAGIVEAYANRGEARSRLGDRAGAVEDFGKVLDHRPRSWEAWTRRGTLRYELRDLRGALEDFSAALRLRPDDPERLNDRAGVLHDLGEYDRALADCEAALRLRPEYPDALANRGAVRLGLSDPRGAVADFAAALRLRPDIPEILVNRGIARHAMSDLRGAAEDFDSALRLRPEYDQAHAARGIVRRDLGDPSGSVEDLTAALAVRADDPEFLGARGLARRDLGDLPGALSDLDRAVARDERNPTYRSNRALTLAQLGRHDEALAEAARALAADPQGPYYAHAARGLVFLRQAELAKALAEFERFEALAAPGDMLRKEVAAWRREAAGGPQK
ncbi:MAG: tetratricopeptide repeat protein [Planctomycetales bacterium]|nr:tetratricopeptide repeat protein [Planctomycetales bacterium]